MEGEKFTNEEVNEQLAGGAGEGRGFDETDLDLITEITNNLVANGEAVTLEDATKKALDMRMAAKENVKTDEQVAVVDSHDGTVEFASNDVAAQAIIEEKRDAE